MTSGPPEILLLARAVFPLGYPSLSSIILKVLCFVCAEHLYLSLDVVTEGHSYDSAVRVTNASGLLPAVL